MYVENIIRRANARLNRHRKSWYERYKYNDYRRIILDGLTMLSFNDSVSFAALFELENYFRNSSRLHQISAENLNCLLSCSTTGLGKYHTSKTAVFFLRRGADPNTVSRFPFPKSHGWTFEMSQWACFLEATITYIVEYSHRGTISVYFQNWTAAVESFGSADAHINTSIYSKVDYDIKQYALVLSLEESPRCYLLHMQNFNRITHPCFDSLHEWLQNRGAPSIEALSLYTDILSCWRCRDRKNVLTCKRSI